MEEVKPTVTLGGRTLTVHKPAYGFRTHLEDGARKVRLKYWSDEVYPALLSRSHDIPPAMINGWLDAIMARAGEWSVNAYELRTYIESVRGVSHLLWHMLDDSHRADFPDVDSIEEFLSPLPLDEVMAAIDAPIIKDEGKPGGSNISSDNTSAPASV